MQPRLALSKLWLSALTYEHMLGDLTHLNETE